jgi:response regulator NasT
MKRPLRIAVADDEVDMRDFYCRMLRAMGHEVVCFAANGRELVEQCRTQRPDLIITDIRMPELDGIEAVKEIGREQSVPIIFISAYHDPELVSRACVDQVMAYLVKPVSRKDLEPAIALAVERFETFERLRNEANAVRNSLRDGPPTTTNLSSVQ